MANPTSSLFPIAKHKVIYAMDRFIEARNKNKAEKYEACINYFSTYRKWFKTYTRTREEAIAALNKHIDTHDYFGVNHVVSEYFRSGSCYEAQQLLKSAHLTKDDVVYLSTEDASWVSNWFREDQ